MKNYTSKTFLALALGLLFFAAGCKKDDVTAPVVTLVGANPLNVAVGSTFTDPGATASDDVDGDLTSKIAVTGTISTTNAGTSTLTYSATDAAGNVGTATRIVNVTLSRDAILGTYSTTTTCTSYPYNTVATTTNFTTNSSGDKFTINMFYYNGGTLNCTLSGNTVTVDAGQNPTPITDGVTGSGTFNATGKVLTMNYTFIPNGAPTVSCSVTYTRP
jgi:hypothetical protein